MGAVYDVRYRCYAFSINGLPLVAERDEGGTA
jgi:hypothetical protein